MGNEVPRTVEYTEMTTGSPRQQELKAIVSQEVPQRFTVTRQPFGDHYLLRVEWRRGQAFSYREEAMLSDFDVSFNPKEIISVGVQSNARFCISLKLQRIPFTFYVGDDLKSAKALHTAINAEWSATRNSDVL